MGCGIYQRGTVWLLAACALAAAAGCVQRRLTIRSNPPGALVYVDNYEIGTTPVSTDFIYYGTREIRLVKDGFVTETRQAPIWAPWYQWFPLDFFAENVVPYEIRDERTLDFQLTPQVVAPTDELLGRAEGLRGGGPVPILAPGTELLPPPGAQAPPEFRMPR